MMMVKRSEGADLEYCASAIIGMVHWYGIGAGVGAITDLWCWCWWTVGECSGSHLLLLLTHPPLLGIGRSVHHSISLLGKAFDR